MIPGLLDSQIRGMTGNEIASRVVGAVIGIVRPEKSQRTLAEYQEMNAELIAELARIINDIRAADRS